MLMWVLIKIVGPFFCAALCLQPSFPWVPKKEAQVIVLLRPDVGLV